ncbi:hypothetical protein SeMB42_g06116 [Synchytrium endobioticum]|uniref:ELMO domain-containing protein n=1 Tax=Synchytrium endobioticum TaxID=286115 RepID=A0A507D2R9_9FUNG|nr:hypothetical protein SeMB42_g06116 [Synchytrium endobioticum]TPX45530.1 hypothetical protein SeLEV6574_g03819 [Synchytrium endobioticum]
MEAVDKRSPPQTEHVSTSSASSTAGSPTAAAEHVKTILVHDLTRVEYIFPLDQSVASTIKDIWGSLSLAQSGPPSNFCIRLCDTDELITDDNLRRKVEDGASLKLTWAPAITARELVDDLNSNLDQSLKKATFSLQKYIKESEFIEEFLACKGLPKLQKVIETSSGNTLAYALSSLHNLMENDHGWESFSREFISTLVNILVKQNLVNICRPATSCIIKLVVADKTSTGAIRCYGYPVVEEALATQPALLHTLCQRLNATDYSLQLYSMSLLNCLFRHASPDRKRSELFRTLDMLNIRAIVIRLMNARPGEELAAQLVEFQRLFIQEMHRRKRAPIDPNQGVHEKILKEIWMVLGAPASPGSKWKLLGFNTENMKKELSRVGVLGLELLQSSVKRDQDYHCKFIQDQLARPVERQCPWGRAQIESLEVLCDYWEISSGYTTSTSYQPLLLSFETVQDITFRCFVRLWAEMEAQSTGDDANRVAALVRSQLWWCLGRIKRTEKDALKIFEKGMLDTPYHVVRERQVRELENADDLSSKAIVRTLRDRLSAESYQFIKQQRVGCLVAGAWFPIFKEKGRDKKMMRFYRLSPNRQYLHYGDFADGFDRKPSIEALLERDSQVDMSLATDILRGTASPVFASKRNASEDLELCFSLVSSTTSSEGIGSTSNNTPQTLGDFACGTPDRCSEWADGFAMLMDKNIMTQPTSELIRELVEIGVQVALLDLTGEGCLPNASTFSSIEVPELPKTLQFWFDGRTPTYVPARGVSQFTHNKGMASRRPLMDPKSRTQSEKGVEQSMAACEAAGTGGLDIIDSYQ